MNWFSAFWFYPSTLRAFHWDNRTLLWLLTLIPLFLFFKWVFQSHRKYTLLLSLESVKRSQGFLVKLRFLVPFFFMCGVFSLLLAIARPQLPNSSSENLSEGVDIALAIDVSDSMLETDFKPNRLEAAKDVARSFISKRENDRIALIAFAGETVSISPLTTDYASLDQYLSSLSTDVTRVSGTALGDALASCINKLRDVTGKSRVAIVISDGDNTGGQIAPEMANELAKTFNIRVYTIAIGTQNSKEKVDERMLKVLAGDPERFFRTTDKSSLDQIFKEIDAMEKSRAESLKVYDMVDYYYQYVYWALFFFITSFFLRFTFLGNILED